MSALTILSGCSAPPAEPVLFLPPAILLDDCRLPSREGVRTNGDLVRIILADEAAINEHNANMQALREYRAGLLQKGYGHANHD